MVLELYLTQGWYYLLGSAVRCWDADSGSFSVQYHLIHAHRCQKRTEKTKEKTFFVDRFCITVNGLDLAHLSCTFIVQPRCGFDAERWWFTGIPCHGQCSVGRFRWHGAGDSMASDNRRGWVTLLNARLINRTNSTHTLSGKCTCM